MTPDRPPTDLDNVFDALRIYLGRYWPGEVADELVVRLRGRRQAIRLPVPCPPLRLARGRPAGPGPPAPGTSACAADGHAPDFRQVTRGGRTFELTPAQAAVVRTLFQAREHGTPDVSEAALLEEADSDAGRLRDIFRRSDAWGTLVVRGDGERMFRLAEPGDADPPGAA